ncbi:histone deacetylase [Streptomyces sp. NPDC059875]|uniref:histone deacetylase n=1 Tax=unclassified Streptomyces TaxID=2593676 RepID=UPI00365110E2
MNAEHTSSPRRPAPRIAASSAASHVWYASYGSNMHAARLNYYLAGGRPPGAARTCPGCRDTSAPVQSLPVVLPGTVYFATESSVWTGGRGFYDPAAPGEAFARAHLITVGQFSDIAAQEMYEEPGRDLDLSEVLAHGRAEIGPGRYETLVCAGSLDGIPVLTFTAPWRMSDVPLREPSAPYVQHVAAGLSESGAWGPAEIAAYLATCPGAAGHWTAETVLALIEPD